MMDEIVTIRVTRDTAQKLKVLAILQGLKRGDYLTKIANKKYEKFVPKM